MWRSRRTLRRTGDPALLRGLLDNLLSNAWKFSSHNARPTIALGQTADGVFFVRDNGIGFDAPYASQLCQPFIRLHQEYEGTGIGLATVRRIVQRHGGEVWAVGELNRGATFYFTLKAAAAPREAVAAACTGENA